MKEVVDRRRLKQTSALWGQHLALFQIQERGGLGSTALGAFSTQGDPLNILTNTRRRYYIPQCRRPFTSRRREDEGSRSSVARKCRRKPAFVQHYRRSSRRGKCQSSVSSRFDEVWFCSTETRKDAAAEAKTKRTLIRLRRSSIILT